MALSLHLHRPAAGRRNAGTPAALERLGSP